MSPTQTHPWRYAVGMFGTSIPINMFVTYMAFYYVDSRGLDNRVYAAIMVGYAIIDAIDNPVYGYLSDRTRTRWGRRRPWLVAGAPVLALSLIAFFSAPGALRGVELALYFAVFAILVETVDSLVNTNYGALLPELFPDERKRARVNALRQGCQLVAIIISVALTPLLKEAIGFPATAALLGTVAAGVILVTASGSREDPARLSTREPRVGDSVRAILGTKTFWGIAITNGAYASGITLLLAGTPFFVKYVLGLEDSYATPLLATVIVASIAFLAVWARLVQRRGAIVVWRASLALLALAFIPLYFATSLPSAIGAGLLIGCGYSGVIATADLVVARLIDLDAARHRVHREAMFIAAFGFFNRLSSLTKSLAFFTVSVAFGYVSGEQPGPRADDAARFLMAVAPCVLIVVAAVTSHFVRFPAPATEEPGRVPALRR